MIGVAPEAELLAVSVGFGTGVAKPFTEQIAEAIRWGGRQRRGRHQPVTDDQHGGLGRELG